MQKDPKDKKQGLSPLYFGSFCTILMNLTARYESALSAPSLYLLSQGDVQESFLLFKSEKMKFKVYRCFGKDQ